MLLPLQIEVSLDIVIVGSAFTVIVDESLELHPIASVKS